MIEREKYEAMWAHDAYRVVAPGAFAVNKFLEVANPKAGETIRDLGCGTGRAGLSLADAGLAVTQYDFAANCRDPEVTLPFVQHDLTQHIPGEPLEDAPPIPPAPPANERETVLRARSRAVASQLRAQRLASLLNSRH